MSYYGNDNPKSAVGDLEVAETTPITQISARYGILDNVTTIETLSGTTEENDSKYVVSSGTDALSLGYLATEEQMYVKGGQGGMCIFDCLFGTPTIGNQQLAGFVNSEDAFGFGSIDDNFGIIHYYGGVNESLLLTVTTNGTGTATVTIDGIGYPVTLTAGDENHNAFEIAQQLNIAIPDYVATSNLNNIHLLAQTPTPRGSYSFAGSTAVTIFIQETPATFPTVDFVPVDTWNGVLFDGYDFNKLNNYKVVFDGNITFFIQNPETSGYDLVHTIQFTNNFTEPHTTNPSFRGGFLSRNIGGTTNVTMQSSKLGMFLQGKYVESTSFIISNFNSGDFSATKQTILTIRNSSEFKNKVNRSNIRPIRLVLSTESAKGMIFEIQKDPTFTDDVVFEYTNDEKSISEFSKSQATLTDGQIIGTYVLAASSINIDLDKFFVTPDTVIAITAYKAVIGNAEFAAATFVWNEDL